MYENSAITDQGRALVAACMAAGHSIEFTSYTLGAGTYSDAEKDPDNLRTLTALKNQKQTFPFVGVGSSSGNECILNIQVDNDGLSTGYYMTEAGVWAKDGDDPSSTPILYQIGVDDNPSYMPDEDTSPLAIDTECHTAIAAAANFTFTFVHGAYAWASDLGDINDLHTANKDSAVDAINEVRDEVRPISRGGTGFSYAFDALNNLGGVQLGATATKNTDSQVATSDYLGGKIFCKDGYLYKATKKIAIGDTIYLTGVNKNAKMVLLADEVSDSVGKEALADYTENEFKATRNYHTVGVYIYIRATRELYKTTVSIDYDETLDTSTNIEQATVGGELARINIELASVTTGTITKHVATMREDVFTLHKNNKIAQLFIDNLRYNTAFSSDTKIATLEYKPYKRYRFVLYTSSASWVYGFVDTYGDMYITNYTAQDLIYGNLIYITA